MTYAIVLNKSDLTRDTPKAWGFWKSCAVACSPHCCCATAWFPKSQCQLEDHAPDTYRLLAPDWLAKKNGCANTSFEGIDYVSP